MAGYTRIQRKLAEYVEDKFIGRVKSMINTEWDTRMNQEGTIPPSVEEHEYFQKRVLEIIADFENSNKGDAKSEEESTTEV